MSYRWGQQVKIGQVGFPRPGHSILIRAATEPLNQGRDKPPSQVAQWCKSPSSVCLWARAIPSSPTHDWANTNCLDIMVHRSFTSLRRVLVVNSVALPPTGADKTCSKICYTSLSCMVSWKSPSEHAKNLGLSNHTAHVYLCNPTLWSPMALIHKATSVGKRPKPSVAKGESRALFLKSLSEAISDIMNMLPPDCASKHR